MNRTALTCLLCLAACGLPQESSRPPVARSQSALLTAKHRIAVQQAQSTAWSFDEAVAMPNLAWSMYGMGVTPWLPLRPSSQMSLRYEVEGSNVDVNPAQLLALARDPVELRSTFDSLAPGNVAGFTAQVDRCALPDGVLLTTEPDVFASVPTGLAVAPIETDSFFTSCHAPALPIGPAANPVDASSVKTLVSYRAGLCTRAVRFEDIIDPVLEGLDQELGGALGETSCVDVDARWSAASLVTHTATEAGPAPNPTGGFAFQYSVGTHIFMPVPDAAIGINARYQFSEVGGRPSALNVTGNVVATGYDWQNTQSKLQDALTTKIPAALYKTFDEKLAAAPLSPEPPNPVVCKADDECSAGEVCEASESLPGQRTCHRTVFGLCEPEFDDSGLPTGPSESGACGAAAIFMKDPVRTGGELVHLRPEQIDEAISVVSATTPAHKLKNWRCRQPDPKSRGRCEYVIPIKRLNVKPGQLDLVFFDELDEVSRPALPFYLALKSLGREQELCSGAPGGERHVKRARTWTQRATWRDMLSCLGNNPGLVF